MGFSANATTVLELRYLAKEGDGLETPEQMMNRIAFTVAAPEAAYGASPEEVQKLAREFYNLMADHDFWPNSPCIANAGARTGQLSACFVLPVGDSLVQIFGTLSHTVQIHQTGGGTGFCFSGLREEGAIVNTTQGPSSGALSFLDVYNAATESIKQGGMRRGANMATFRIDHPDILKFIRHKQDKTKLTNFNVSCLVTNAFMEAVEKGENYELISPKTGPTGKFLDARAVFKEMVKGAHGSGEPGCLFVDHANRTHPLIGYVYEATNPCGEQWLDPYDSCNLGSINLGRFVVEGNFDGLVRPVIDWDRFGRVIDLTVQFLDLVIDANKYVIPQIEMTTKANRRIGLGGMGFADMLIKLGVAYGSEESFEIAEQVQTFLSARSQARSVELARYKGNFPNHPISIYGPQGSNTPMRNAATGTWAPTGTLSIIADCSSGCEPLFAVGYMRNQAGQRMPAMNPMFVSLAQERGFYSDDLMERIAEHGTVQGMAEVPEDVQRLFVTAHDLSPDTHVRMQATLQRAGDRVGGMNSISKTINFREDAPIEDVERAYLLAWKTGCKGITVYRNGSRDNQPLQTTAKVEQKPNETVITVRDREFTGETFGRKTKVNTPYGTMHVYLGRNEAGELVEMISTIGKNGGVPNSEAEAISRLCSLMLRKGMEQDIIDQLRGISNGGRAFDRGKIVTSVADGIAQVLEEEIHGKVEKIRAKDVMNHDHQCPECPDKLVFGGGCFNCPSCGYSKCG